MDCGEKYLAHMGQYPVIYLTFKDAKRKDFEESYRQIADVIAYEFDRHAFVMESTDETVKDWYNGYSFGQTDIYNPWSVIKYIYDTLPNRNWLPMSYWANTSSNSIVKTLIDQADDEDKAKIERLLTGDTIEIQIHEDITYNEIYDEGDNLWNFMFFTGYFRKVREWMTGTTIYAELTIPNKEVKYILEQKVQKWFCDRLRGRDLQLLHNAVLSRDCTVSARRAARGYCGNAESHDTRICPLSERLPGIYRLTGQEYCNHVCRNAKTDELYYSAVKEEDRSIIVKAVNAQEDA